MAEIRAFIAISLPPEFQVQLEKVSQELRDLLTGVPVRWVPIKNMHLTLKFLGNIAEGKVEELKQVLKYETDQNVSFEIGLDRLGAFPNLNRPRVVWVGISAPKELITLARGIEHAAEKIGYPSENRPFSPHLTLGRVGKNISAGGLNRIGDAIQVVKPVLSPTTRVTEIHLYRSVLQPDGPIYSRLYTAHLA